MERKKFKLPLGFVFDESGQILLLKRIDRKNREPVKGGIEEGETHKETILRELFEETGFGEKNIVEFYYDGKREFEDVIDNEYILERSLFVYFIKVKGINPIVKINNIEEGGIDHNGYGWFEQEELKDLYIQYPDVLKEIEKGRKYFGL